MKFGIANIRIHFEFAKQKAKKPRQNLGHEKYDSYEIVI